ncbi:hypothetical protein ACLESO_00175 [Pyxidicoccus sp. 3LG]
MRAAWMMLGVLWLGCSVQLTEVPCLDDLQCLEAEHCGPEAVCVEGARTAQMLGESCRAAVRSAAAHASECLNGAEEDFVRLLGPDAVCVSVEASVAAGRQVFRPELFGECVRGLQRRACGELDPELPSRETLLQGCPAFEPQVAEGAACTNTADCQGGWCSTTEVCPGVCRAFIPLGEACTSQDRCQRGSSCAGGVCRRDAAVGERCGGGVLCESGADTHCENGWCVEHRKQGACDNHDQCSLRYRCVKTQPALGNSSPKECRPAQALGEACEPGAESCGRLSFCHTGTRTCRSWPTPNESCDASNYMGESVFCLEGSCNHISVSPMCVGPDPVGETCVRSLECGPSGTCRDFRCVPLWCG